ncbi:MAG: GNAT family N-acetyltransferase [Burkholderiales bacterium]
MPASEPRLRIAPADPQGPEALALLHQAALEARALYPELSDPNAPWPTNAPMPPRGIYFIASLEGRAVGMGAHRPLDADCTELRRMFVDAAFRQQGVARALLEALEAHARSQGFSCLRLETGMRQSAAMALYESFGFARIPAFGEYVGDATSRCFEKRLQAI